MSLVWKSRKLKTSKKERQMQRDAPAPNNNPGRFIFGRAFHFRLPRGFTLPTEDFYNTFSILEWQYILRLSGATS